MSQERDDYRPKGISLDHHTPGGLFGELQVQVRIDPTTGENLGEGWVRSDNGSPLAGGRNRHVRAVAALICGRALRTDSTRLTASIERKMTVRVLYNPDAAVPLCDVFNDPDDAPEWMNP